MRWAVASAAESVIVTMKPVAANPSRQSASALPRHRGSSSSRTEMLPCPLRAQLRHAPVHRERAEERQQQEDSVASGDSTPAARNAMPG